jgi:hypothetical protein
LRSLSTEESNEPSPSKTDPTPNKVILGKKRGQGRKPKHSEELKTVEFTEGCVKITRAIFRRFTKHFKGDK